MDFSHTHVAIRFRRRELAIAQFALNFAIRTFLQSAGPFR